MCVCVCVRVRKVLPKKEQRNNTSPVRLSVSWIGSVPSDALKAWSIYIILDPGYLVLPTVFVRYFKEPVFPSLAVILSLKFLVELSVKPTVTANL